MYTTCSIRRAVAALACLFMATAVWAQEETDRIVATVGDKVFTTMDVRRDIAPQLARLKALYSGDDLKAKTAELFSLAIEAIVNRELIYLDFKSLKGANIPDSFIQEQIDHTIANVSGGDAIAFEEKLYLDGMSMKEYREKVFQDVVVELLLQNRTRNGISIPDEAIVAFYEENKHDYVAPIRYHLAIILLKGDGKYAGRLDETIAEIQAALAAKTPFADLARRYSEDANAANGGDMGEMEEINETLKAALKDMDVGMTTPKPVVIGENRYFVHILDMDGGGLPPLNEEIKKNIKAELERREQKRRLGEYLKQLNMKYPVKRYKLD